MMFEELIEKINALEGHVFFKDDIIELIKACEPQELDAPDSDGWWWFRNLNRSHPFPFNTLICVKLLHLNVQNPNSFVFFYNNNEYETHNYTGIGEGKWQRAIVPKEKQ